MQQIPQETKKIRILPKQFTKHKDGSVVWIAGKQHKAGDVISAEEDVTRDLIFRGKAELVTDKIEVASNPIPQKQKVRSRLEFKKLFAFD